MCKFDEYITDDKIIFSLCKIRAKCAQQRSKRHLIHLLSTSDKFNYHVNCIKNDKTSDELELLNSLLPSRRKWKKLTKRNRYPKNNQRINTVDYNVKSLLLTIKYYKKHNPKEQFLLNLKAFILDLKTSVEDPNYSITPPTITPRLKGNKKAAQNICRPISLFALKDRLIIRFANKYFTEVFDKYFYPKSYAFRAIQRNETGKTRLSHHDAIQSILDYKKQYKGKRLWVSECDISKFYDSVHHTIVKRAFKTLIKKAKRDTPALYDIRAERILYKYLDSYSFVKDVLPLNDKHKNESYWSDNNIPDGSFGWVENDLLRLRYFKCVRNANIGVPQGGALSGLIANMVLDYADQEVVTLSNSRLHYVRFCDDMVLIHPSKSECMKASKVYLETLKKLHLVPHEFQSNLENTPDSFWNSKTKSKQAYKWSSNYTDSFPWFGFVGYEIHFSGDLRIRKSSMNREKKKQKEVVSQILKAVKDGKRRTNGTIFESAVNRLIVGVHRINLTKNDKNISRICG